MNPISQKNIYTLISYTPDTPAWIDRCGNFNNGEESQLSVDYFTEIQAIGEALAQAIFNNDDTQTTVLVNGVNVYDYPDFFTKEQEAELQNIEEEISIYRDKKYEELSKEKQIRDEAEKIKKQQEQVLKAQQEKKQQEAIERKQLSQLLAKYGK
jgi:hypothetical protein